MNENTATQPVVELKDGALMGRIKDAVYLFSGIPYAAPPVGPARFKAAQPVQPWEGIRDATKFGPAAPQIPSGGMTDRVPVRWDEDCLTLNVATPSITGDKKGGPGLDSWRRLSIRTRRHSLVQRREFRNARQYRCCHH